MADRIPYKLTSQNMGAAIGQALDEEGISQAEFCRRVGTSPKHLNQVINGLATARAAELDYWAWVLDRQWGDQPGASRAQPGGRPMSADTSRVRCLPLRGHGRKNHNRGDSQACRHHEQSERQQYADLVDLHCERVEQLRLRLVMACGAVDTAFPHLDNPRPILNVAVIGQDRHQRVFPSLAPTALTIASDPQSDTRHSASSLKAGNA